MAIVGKQKSQSHEKLRQLSLRLSMFLFRPQQVFCVFFFLYLSANGLQLIQDNMVLHVYAVLVPRPSFEYTMKNREFFIQQTSIQYTSLDTFRWHVLLGNCILLYIIADFVWMSAACKRKLKHYTRWHYIYIVCDVTSRKMLHICSCSLLLFLSYVWSNSSHPKINDGYRNSSMTTAAWLSEPN